MNIFFLDQDPEKAARYQCNKHIVKMVLESAQLLSTAHHETNSKYAPLLYKATHKNHPCSVWTRSSQANYNWLYRHFLFLSDEYFRRYDKVHKTARLYSDLLGHTPDIPDVGFTEPALAMYDECKCECPVESYRRYYRVKKREIDMRWPENQVPDFMKVN